MHLLCRLEDIPEDSARECLVEGQSLVLVHRDGQLFAYLNWCPHLGIELNFQPDVFLDQDNRFIQCANHGALFEIESGHCLSGPCNGDNLVAVPISVRDGQIWADTVPTPG